MKAAIKGFGRLGWIRPTILLLLVCHMGRFYADAPLALAICFEHNHASPTAHLASGMDDHHAAHVDAGEPESSSDHGFKLEHCKDTFQGLNLIPATVLSPPAEQVAMSPARPGDVALPQAAQVHSDLPISIFHPPQLLS